MAPVSQNLPIAAESFVLASKSDNYVFRTTMSMIDISSGVQRYERVLALLETLRNYSRLIKIHVITTC